MNQQQRRRPHYSVMRIEKAKQNALTGSPFCPVEQSSRMIMDWTGADEEALFMLIEQWNPETDTKAE